MPLRGGEISSQDKIWLHHIKKEYVEEYSTSKLTKPSLTAKFYYLKNLYARMDIYFCVANLIEVASTPGFIKSKNYKLSTKNLSSLLEPETNAIKIFSKFNDAVHYSEQEYWKNPLMGTSISGFYEYYPVFTVNLKNKPVFPIAEEKSEINSKIETIEYNTDNMDFFTRIRNKGKPSSEIQFIRDNSKNIAWVHSIFYKAGVIGSSQSINMTSLKLKDQPGFIQNNNEEKNISSKSNISCVIS